MSDLTELVRRFFGPYPITTGYGAPTYGNPSVPHTGIDIGEPLGTAVRPTDYGVVTRVFSDPVGGLQEEVVVKGGWHELFAHLSAIAPGISSQVARGLRPSVGPQDVVAYSGTSGRSSGPHLHFEVRDPLGALFDPGKFLDIEASQPASSGVVDARDLPVVGGLIDVGGAAVGSRTPAKTGVGQAVQEGGVGAGIAAAVAPAGIALLIGVLFLAGLWRLSSEV